MVTQNLKNIAEKSTFVLLYSPKSLQLRKAVLMVLAMIGLTVMPMAVGDIEQSIIWYVENVMKEKVDDAIVARVFTKVAGISTGTYIAITARIIGAAIGVVAGFL